MLPRKFQFEMGGFHSGRYSLVWDGTQLVHDAWGPAFADSCKKIQPSLQQWENFERRLQEIGAYDWKREYSEPELTGEMPGLLTGLIIGDGSQAFYVANLGNALIKVLKE